MSHTVTTIMNFILSMYLFFFLNFIVSSSIHFGHGYIVIQLLKAHNVIAFAQDMSQIIYIYILYSGRPI